MKVVTKGIFLSLEETSFNDRQSGQKQVMYVLHMFADNEEHTVYIGAKNPVVDQLMCFAIAEPIEVTVNFKKENNRYKMQFVGLGNML